MLDRGDGDRLDEILDAVLAAPEDARTRLVSELCGDDVTLREDVERLLRTASPHDDFLERVVFRLDSSSSPPDPPRFIPETLLAGRFRVVRMLGRGGMGEVYEAFDIELNTAIAIKTLRVTATNAGSVGRLHREVLRARQVAHPNVCRVYDLFSHRNGGDEIPFLTMELVAGVSLAERMAGTRLSYDETVRIATQVAAAIDEAHRLHIVHRDLKPGNIMLAPAGADMRAVVTDFGLAGQIAEEAGTAARLASQIHGGTDDYMAPEQRESGIVGPAADIYAFGVLVHEMLTGERPRDRSDVHLDLPQRWSGALVAALEADAAARPASASEVLRLATETTDSVGRPDDRRQSWRRDRLTIVLIGAAALILLVALSPFIRGVRSDPLEAAVAVMTPIANRTGEPALDALTDMLQQQLSQSTFLTLLDGGQVRDALRTMARTSDTFLTPELGREIAWRRQADVVVSGRVQPAAQRGYVLSTEVERRAERPDLLGRTWQRTFEARDRAELLRMVQEASRWIRGIAGEAASDIPKADRPVEEVTSPSWEAVALYSRAERLATQQGRLDDTLALLSEAVRLDPDFALAWMRIGDLQMSVRRLDEGAAHWDKALHVLERRQLTKREEYRIRGVYANDTHDYAEAERAYRLWLLEYPHDPKPYFYIARPLMMQGRTDEAIRMMEAARERDRYSYYIPLHLTTLYLRANRLDAAEGTIANLREIGEAAWADSLQGQLDVLRNHAAAALARFEQLGQGTHPLLASRGPVLQAALLADAGRIDEAIARLEQGAAKDLAAGRQKERADKLLFLADLELARGRRRDARDRCVLVEQIDRSARRLAPAAALLARAGYPEDAERMIARFDGARSIRSLEVDRRRIRGEVLLARGNARAAWVEFQQAATLDAPGVPLEYLARGAAAAGETGTALALYARIAGDREYYWHYPEGEALGTWARGTERYFDLARALSPSPDTADVRRRYATVQQGLASLPRN
jgi:eukaryotic-like serine/threonine-protein kinase